MRTTNNALDVSETPYRLIASDICQQSMMHWNLSIQNTRTLLLGLRVHSTSECTVFVLKAPWVYAKIAWYTAVWRCNKLHIFRRAPSVAIQRYGEARTTDKTGIDKSKAKRLPLDVAILAQRRGGLDDARAQLASVLDVGEEGEMNDGNVGGEVGVAESEHGRGQGRTNCTVTEDTMSHNYQL